MDASNSSLGAPLARQSSLLRREIPLSYVLIALAVLAPCGMWLHWRFTHATITVINESGRDISDVELSLSSTRVKWAETRKMG